MNSNTVAAVPTRRDERVLFSRAFATATAAAVVFMGGGIVAASADSMSPRVGLRQYCAFTPGAFCIPVHRAPPRPSTRLLLRASSSSKIVVARLKIATQPIGRSLLPCLSQSRPLDWRENAAAGGGEVCLCMTSSDSSVAQEDGGEDDEEGKEEEEAEPGTMRVSEIKAELKLRGVDFSDCFDRDSLAQRLSEARESGRADPSIIDDFNRKNLEANFKGGGAATEINDEQIEAVVSGDGTLPGGMTPETLKKLMSNPELMALLQSVKMQEVMKLMMTEGQEALEDAMRDDPEVREIVTKLNEVMGSAL